MVWDLIWRLSESTQNDAPLWFELRHDVEQRCERKTALEKARMGNDEPGCGDFP